jgi:hypothetical protein
MIQKFVRKVEVGTDSFKIHYIVDQEHYKRELALKEASSRLLAGRRFGLNFSNNLSSNTLTFGAQVEQVGEHPNSRSAPFVFELEEFQEGKALSLPEFRVLCGQGMSFQQIANLIGASEAFVRQTLQRKKYKHANRGFKTRRPLKGS